MADTAPAPRPLRAAAVASLGAGAIHAAAIGVHSEHRSAVVAFTIVAALQLAWGALALVRGGRLVALGGAVVSAGALGGWALAKTSGIGFVAGLDEAESVQWADGAAAALAALTLVVTVVELIAGDLPARTPRRAARWRAPASAVLAVAVVGVTASAMVSAGSHSHAGGHGHDDETAAAHSHSDDPSHDDADHDDPDHDDPDHDDGHDAEPVAIPAKPYDPELPIDFSGVDGVTPQQQAAAENLVSRTLLELPQFGDAAAAEAAGWSSIGDGFTGHEHLINWDLLDDGRVLDPNHPESLVYDTSGGGRRLVSAMFMLEPGSSLDSVPELGGALTQWHIHDNLCFTSGEEPRVVGVTSSGGPCRPGTERLTPVPMIHVWIEPHPCGPFAALEGVAAGQVKEGETHLCNHEHGSG